MSSSDGSSCSISTQNKMIDIKASSWSVDTKQDNYCSSDKISIKKSC